MSVMVGTTAVEAWPIETVPAIENIHCLNNLCGPSSPWLTVDQVIQQWSPVESSSLEKALIHCSSSAILATTTKNRMLNVTGAWCGCPIIWWGPPPGPSPWKKYLPQVIFSFYYHVINQSALRRKELSPWLFSQTTGTAALQDVEATKHIASVFLLKVLQDFR